jgi:hypothetical protein
MDASVLAAARGAMLSMMLLRASASMCISLLAALLAPISTAEHNPALWQLASLSAAYKQVSDWQLLLPQVASVAGKLSNSLMLGSACA